MNNMHDVVVIGGGLVGGLTALLLQQGGVKVTVLDAAPILQKEKILAQANPRVLALSKATIQLLKHAQVWENLDRYMPYTGMQVWNQDGYGEILFGTQSLDFPCTSTWLGVMVEPSILNLAIQEQLQVQVDDYQTGVQVTSVEKMVEGWKIVKSDGDILYTHLVIGADGANSFVREQAQIGLDILDYKQAAISCAIKTKKHHEYVARQLFLPTGPLAFLPMASLNAEDNGYWQSIVWTLPDDYVQEYTALSDTEFAQKMTQVSLHMLGEVIEVTSRAAFPLKARSAQHYVQNGLALVGDAAHVIHPLAGQGVNIGCLDAAILADVLLNDLKRGVWAHLHTLRRYEHIRKGQNEAMMHSMSAIGWLERSTFTPLVWARNFGLRQVNQTEQLKHQFMAQANGLSILKNTRYAV